jgi:hypothetical protein
MNDEIKKLAVEAYREVYNINIDGLSGNLNDFVNLFSIKLLERSAEIAKAYTEARFDDDKVGDNIKEHFNLK